MSLNKGYVNKVTFLGDVTGDPEIKPTTYGNMARLTVMTCEYWVDGAGEKRETISRHGVTIFSRNIVDLVRESVISGSRVYLEGTLRNRKWQDEAGNDRWATEVTVSGLHGRFFILDGDQNKKEGMDSEGKDFLSNIEAAKEEEEEEALPF